MSESIDKAVSLIRIAKKWMSFIVLILMTIIVAIAIVELGIILYSDLFDPTDDVLFLEVAEFMGEGRGPVVGQRLRHPVRTTAGAEGRLLLG